ncbi:MAG TPA: UDP-N-acetylmuramoyl-L-alanine--D-glutamate ligase [Steroidobacteraceae bacterium]|jgi:UDP-N-acetylmuramoylalanine--D-glutamate ligase|nr:UDP-N-acetylmuramoyl-L-alanine--D-glutamate ligase [Steroidobacteraceae bacterium]
MSTASATPLRAVIVGLGKTGYSVARFLLKRGTRVAVTDSRAEPPELARLAALGGDVVVRSGGFDAALLEQADLVVVSPGVALTGPFFDAARARGLSIVGDIELFARAARAPVVGITGTNGKSTVTTLLEKMAARSGLKMRAGGNLGAPALDLLDGSVELYILELSSFQLETTESLSLAAATVLNVTPDHLDRYPDLAAYAAAKARIFARCDVAVINLDDPLVAAMVGPGRRQLSFSLRADVGADYVLMRREDGDWWLMRREEPLLALSQMRLTGLHNAANALAALALAEALALPRGACIAALAAFTGLAHRTQWLAEIGGVRYVNDSKGTNVGATLAAVDGMPGPLVVIAGGDGKGQDFTPLRAAFAGKVRAAVLIGRAARSLGAALSGVSALHYAPSLEAAVECAARVAQPGDTVLLSPACASLDMFRDYRHRGEVFADAVQRRSA